MTEQISLFDNRELFPTANFRLLGKLLRIENGVRIISNDFYCSNCGKELFHNGEMMRKTPVCPFCNATLIPIENFERIFLK